MNFLYGLAGSITHVTLIQIVLVQHIIEQLWFFRWQKTVSYVVYWQIKMSDLSWIDNIVRIVIKPLICLRMGSASVYITLHSNWLFADFLFWCSNWSMVQFYANSTMRNVILNICFYFLLLIFVLSLFSSWQPQQWEHPRFLLPSQRPSRGHSDSPPGSDHDHSPPDHISKPSCSNHRAPSSASSRKRVILSALV